MNVRYTRMVTTTCPHPRAPAFLSSREVIRRNVPNVLPLARQFLILRIYIEQPTPRRQRRHLRSPHQQLPGKTADPILRHINPCNPGRHAAEIILRPVHVAPALEREWRVVAVRNHSAIRLPVVVRRQARLIRARVRREQRVRAHQRALALANPPLPVVCRPASSPARPHCP